MNARIASLNWHPVPGKTWGLVIDLRLKDGTHLKRELTIEPVVPIQVTREEYPSMPLFELLGGWNAGGICPDCLKAQVNPWCAGIRNAINLESVKVETPRGDELRFGLDFTAIPEWDVIGRLPSGRIRPDDKVYLTYSYFPPRLDNIVLRPDNSILQIQGIPGTSTPHPPALADGDELLGRIYFDEKRYSLSESMLFPLVEEAFPGYPNRGTAENLLPKTLEKLQKGENLHILAWGDSVTASLYMPEEQKWQNLFLQALKQKYPQANITLTTRAWGGHRTVDFLNAPSGDEHNYAEQILAVDADLVITEFVNDCSLEDITAFNNAYDTIRKDLQNRQREWIICTPHLILPKWMGLTSPKGLEHDPRKFVEHLHDFTREHRLALADASLRWCHLWKEAIPYTSLLTNAINHPDSRGMQIYADAILALFP